MSHLHLAQAQVLRAADGRVVRHLHRTHTCPGVQVPGSAGEHVPRLGQRSNLLFTKRPHQVVLAIMRRLLRGAKAPLAMT